MAGLLTGNRWRLPATLTLLVVLAHGLAFLAPFQFDDEHQIELNKPIMELSSIPRFFVDPWVGSTLGYVRFYRPVLFVTFAIDGSIGGGSALPFRITSMVLLVVFALLAQRFIEQLLPRIVLGASAETARHTSLLAAALLVVHPLMNESILLATGRSSLLMAVFGLGALLLLADRRGELKRTVGVIGLTTLALLTKESAVVLLMVAPLVTWLTRPEERWIRRLLAVWPIAIPVALFAAFFLGLPFFPTFLPGPSVPAPSSTIHFIAYADRPAQAAAAFLGLGRLFLVPWNLSLVHAISTPAGVRWWLLTAFWPVLLLLVFFLWRRPEGRGRLVAFAILWPAAALFPILAAGLNTPMGEHRVVLGMVGPVVAVAFGILTITKKRGRGWLVGGLLGLLAVAAAVQTWPWRSKVSLWNHEVTIHATNGRAWSFLAKAYQAQGNLEEAKNAIGQAMEHAPNVPAIIGRAALIEQQRGNFAGAADLASQVVALDDSYAEMHLLVAEKLAMSGQLPTALTHARRAVELLPNSSSAWNALGNVLFMLGNQEAVQAYRRAIELDPQNKEAAVNLQRLQRATRP